IAFSSTPVSSTLSFPAPAALRDSRLRLSDMCDVVLGSMSRALVALVLSMPRGLAGRSSAVDRTRSRSKLAFTVFVSRFVAWVNETLRQPDAAWTITHGSWMPTHHVRRTGSARRASHDHNTSNRSEPRAESPRGPSRVAIDEKRNPDQRGPARDSGRDPRGRPARRAAG